MSTELLPPPAGGPPHARVGDVPVLDLALVVVGLPVIATVGSWLLAGREPPAIAHQPIE